MSITDSVDPSGAASYTWDANGNQTSETRGGLLTEYLYDARDQLTEVRRAGSLFESYGYDYKGLRVRKSGAAGVVRYVYDDASVLLQTDAAGNTLAKYDYGPDRLLSLAHATEGRQYYLFDGLGSVVDLMRPDGALQARYQYDAWGNPRSTAGSSFNVFGFTGHERDEATGLYYFKARYYDPETGRFLTEDPFGGTREQPPSLHRYLYAYQNPTVYTDPTGRITVVKKLAESTEKKSEEFINQAEQVQQVLNDNPQLAADPLVRLIALRMAVENGQVAGGLAYLGDSIKLANFVINLSIINDLVTKGLNYGDLTTQAFSELTEGIADVARVVAVLRENPGRVGTELLDSAAEYLKALSHGDLKSVAQISSTVTQIAIDAALAAVGGEIGAAERGGAKVAGAVAEVGEEAGIRILRQGGDVVEVGVREIDVSSTTIVVDMEKVIEGSRRPPRSGGERSRAIQALQKKIDRRDRAFQGLEKSQDAANQVIREVLGAEKPIIRTGTNRNGEAYVDIFNPSTGRGVRLIDGAFDTFVNLD